MVGVGLEAAAAQISVVPAAAQTTEEHAGLIEIGFEVVVVIAAEIALAGIEFEAAKTAEIPAVAVIELVVEEVAVVIAAMTVVAVD
jgi:hypothetical protein